MTRLVLLLPALALVSCGGDKPTPDPATTETSSATTAPASVITTRPVTPIAQVVANAAPATCDATAYPDLARVGMAPATHTVVFLDRSSTATDTTSAGPYGRAIEATLSTAALAHGSVVDVYPLHDRTTGKAGHTAVQVLAALPATRAKNDLERKQACDGAMRAFARSVVGARTELQRAFRETATSPENARGSDVWGALQVVSEAAQDDPAGAPLRVLFLSDMMHCRTGQRCLENPGPKSAAEAQAWGTADAARAKRDLSLNEARLKTATYTVVSGDFASSKAYEFVPAYWRAFLGTFGVPDTQVRFNP